MHVFENRFVKFEVFSEESLFVETWTAETTNMLPHEWQEIHLELAKTFETFRTSRLLVLSKAFNFMITPDLQKWLAEKVFPRGAASGLKKIAFVVPDDLFASVSVEQLMEEDTERVFITRYFKDEIRARQWLSS